MKNKIKISLITIALIIPLFVRPVLAEGSNIYTWVYGTYTSDFSGALDNIETGVINIPYGDGVIPIPIVKTRAYQEISVQLSNYMYGSVQMTLSPVSNLNWADIYVSGASIDSWNYTTGVLNLRVQGNNNFTVTILSRKTFTAFLTTSLSVHLSGSLTATNSPAYNLNQIDLKLANTNSTLNDILTSTGNQEDLLADILTYSAYIDDINSALTTTNTTLSNIYSRLNTLNDINTNIFNLGIPSYSLSIYRMLTQNDPSKIGSNEYGKFVPYIDTTTLTNYVRNTEDYVMIYATGASNVYPVFTESDTTATVLRTVRSYNNYFYVVQISTTTSGEKHFTFNNASSTRYIYPYFYGWKDYIPQELMSIAVDQYSDAYTIVLNSINDNLDSIISELNNDVDWQLISGLKGATTDYSSYSHAFSTSYAKTELILIYQIILSIKRLTEILLTYMLCLILV